jgi:hypothetical protein
MRIWLKAGLAVNQVIVKQIPANRPSPASNLHPSARGRIAMPRHTTCQLNDRIPTCLPTTNQKNTALATEMDQLQNIYSSHNDIAPLAYSLPWPLPISRNCTSINSAGTQRCQASVHTNHLLRPQEPSSIEYHDVHSKQQRKAEARL